MKPSFLSDNRFEDATPTATDTATGFDVANIADRRPYTTWVAASTGIKYITVDCGTAKSADSVGIAGHNLGTAGATVQVQHSANGTTWYVVGSDITPANDLTILQPFAAVSDRYWRLKITGYSAPAQIGVLCVGTRINPARFPSGAWAPETIKGETEEVTSKAGHLLGATVRFFQKDVSANLQYPGTSWVENTYKPFYLANVGKPFFFGWDLDAWPEKCGLYRFDGNYAPVYDELSRVSTLTFKLRGVHS